MNHEALAKARQWGQQQYPRSPIQHHAAFANSVAYMVTGASGGYGGASVREHAVSHAVGLHGGGERTTVQGLNAFIPGSGHIPAGQWGFEEACQFARSICYGELTDLHFFCYRSENCFDDAAEDIEALKKYSAIDRQ
ncbi:MAG: hypothetical protein AAGD25_06745 [Cyanobacteria bacterium P01_F01_bin.150]